MSIPKRPFVLLLTALPFCLVGCGDDAKSPNDAQSGAGKSTAGNGAASDPKSSGKKEHAEGDHTHGSGPHGGVVADWGAGKFHVEFTVDHDRKEATVYVLGTDEKTPAPVKADEGKLLLTINEPAFQVDLEAAPLEGEKAGASSRYVGRHDNLGIFREFAGTISGAVDGTPYAADFQEEPEAP